MSQDTNLQNLIINKLTKAQYDTIVSPSTTELYFVTDDIGITSSDITSALGYTPYNSSNPSGYQANVIETIKVNGTAQTVTTKTVDLTIPSVGDGQIVFTQNGTPKGTITANQTVNTTISLDSGTSITVDTSLSTSSTNPVENRVITNALQTIMGTATYDSVAESITFAIYDLTSINNQLLTIIAGETSP